MNTPESPRDDNVVRGGEVNRSVEAQTDTGASVLPERITQRVRNMTLRELARQTHYSEEVDLRCDDSPFDALLRQYQPWQRDITVVVETLGVLEMDVSMIEKMNESDRLTLALHIDGYIARLKTHHRIIAAADGDVGAYHILEKVYGSDRSQEEMVAYISTLESLYNILRHMDTVRLLQAVVHHEIPDPGERALRLKHDRQHHGGVQVAFAVTDDGVKRPYVTHTK